MPFLSRRTLFVSLGAVAATTVAAVGGTVLVCAGRDDLAQAPVLGPALDPDGRARLIAALDMALPAEVGDAYAATCGAAALEEELRRARPLIDMAAVTCDATRRARFRTLIQSEFAARDTVLVARWQLARSEALVAGIRTLM